VALSDPARSELLDAASRRGFSTGAAPETAPRLSRSSPTGPSRAHLARGRPSTSAARYARPRPGRRRAVAPAGALDSGRRPRNRDPKAPPGLVLLHLSGAGRAGGRRLEPDGRTGAVPELDGDATDVAPGRRSWPGGLPRGPLASRITTEGAHRVRGIADRRTRPSRPGSSVREGPGPERAPPVTSDAEADLEAAIMTGVSRAPSSRAGVLARRLPARSLLARVPNGEEELGGESQGSECSRRPRRSDDGSPTHRNAPSGRRSTPRRCRG